MFDDDCRAVPVPEVRRTVELQLREDDQRMIETLAARLGLPPESVVRVALLTLASPPRRRSF